MKMTKYNLLLLSKANQLWRQAVQGCWNLTIIEWYLHVFQLNWTLRFVKEEVEEEPEEASGPREWSHCGNKFSQLFLGLVLLWG